MKGRPTECDWIYHRRSIALLTSFVPFARPSSPKQRRISIASSTQHNDAIAAAPSDGVQIPVLFHTRTETHNINVHALDTTFGNQTELKARQLSSFMDLIATRLSWEADPEYGGD